MQTLNLTEAKAHLSAVVQRVRGGEEFLITWHGEPVARISRVDAASKPRLLGMFAGQGWIAEDFDAWPEEEARALGILD